MHCKGEKKLKSHNMKTSGLVSVGQPFNPLMRLVLGARTTIDRRRSRMSMRMENKYWQIGEQLNTILCNMLHIFIHTILCNMLHIFIHTNQHTIIQHTPPPLFFWVLNISNFVLVNCLPCFIIFALNVRLGIFLIFLK